MVFLVSLLIPVLTTLCALKSLVHTHLVLETVIASIIEMFVLWIPIKNFLHFKY